MNSWIDKKGIVTGVVVGIVLFLLYIHFTEQSTVNGATITKLKFGK